jgi:hypothetical protein
MSKIEKVTFYSDGDEIDATIFLPKDLKEGEKRAGVVYASGYLATGSMSYGPPEDLCSAGYIALSFDYRGSDGKSQFKGKLSTPGQSNLFPEICIKDIRSAITFLVSRKEINADRIGLLGRSAGGAFAIAAAAVDQRVSCTVSEGSFGDGYRMSMCARKSSEFKEFISKIEEDRLNRVLTGQSELIPVAGYKNERLGLFNLSPNERKSWSQQVVNPKTPWLEVQTTLEVCESWLEFRPELVVDCISPRPILLIGSESSALIPPDEVPKLFDKANEPKKLIMFPKSVVPSRYEKLDAHKGRSYIPEMWDPIIKWFQNYIPSIG